MIAGLLFAAAGVVAQPAQVPPGPNAALIRVFVRTDEGGDPKELAAREQSVRDLQSALAGKRKTLAVVDDEDLADVVVDVQTLGYVVPKVVIGLGPRPGQPRGTGGPVRAPVLRVELTSGEDSVAFTNKNKPPDSGAGWKSAADNLAGQIDKWIGEHREEILRRRGDQR